MSGTDERPLAERGWAGRQGAGERPAVIVVDFSRGFTEPASPLHCDSDAALAATAELLAAAREAGAPVIYTTVVYDEAGRREAAAFLAKSPALADLTHDSPFAEIDPRIAPADGEPVLEKKFASAFFGTDLDARLKAAGVDTAIVVGASTSGCVRASALDALQYGNRVLVVREAVADRLTEAHDRALLDLDAKYADVVSLAEAVEVLRASAAND
jgi:nicotinamidase-related amidase